MKVIFKKDLQKVAKKHQVKEVSSGFAVNFLIPNGYAVMATPEAQKSLEMLQKTLEADKKVQHALLEKNLKAISEARLTLSAKANDKGHLFSGIHKEGIVSALHSQAHIEIPVDFVHMDKPLKEVGEHKVKIGSGDHEAMLMVVIAAE